MRLLVLSVILASLSTIVGCGAQQRTATTVTPDEACWTPPEEVAMSFDAADAPAAGDKKEKDRPKTVSIEPNRGGDRPTRGAVHAATY